MDRTFAPVAQTIFAGSMQSPMDILVQGTRDGTFPGGQLAASIEGRRLVNDAAGVLESGGQPTHSGVIYDLASLTKPLATTLLFASALEQGLCALSDPIATWMPGAHADVTFEHLLEHSSGYPAHRRLDQALAEAQIVPGTRQAYAQMIAWAKNLPQEQPAGARALYSDIGFMLLGDILEKIYSSRLDTIFSERATRVLFRQSTSPVDSLTAPTEGCLLGQVHDENARAMGGVAGHAGLWGTAEGVLELCEQWVSAYQGLRGGILAPETVRRLWQPSRVEYSTRTLGWDRPSGPDSSTGGRWPAGSVGHLGFTGTSVWIEPERALIVALVSNRVCPRRDNLLIRKLRPRLYDAAWELWSRK